MKQYFLLFTIITLFSCGDKNHKGVKNENIEVYSLSFAHEYANRVAGMNKELMELTQFSDTFTIEVVDSRIKILDSLAMVLILNGATDVSISNFTTDYIFKGYLPTISTTGRSDFRALINSQFPNLKDRLNQFSEHLSNQGFDSNFRVLDATDDPVFAKAYENNPDEAPTFVDYAFQDKSLLNSLTMVYNLELMIEEEFRRYIQSKMKEI